MKTAAIALTILCCSLTSYAQIQEASYILKPVKALYLDSTKSKEIILVFKHSTKSGNDEKFIVSGRFAYSLGDSAEITEVLGRNNHHSITIHGEKIPERDPALYNLIKDSLNVSPGENLKLLVFYLRGVTDVYIPTMTFTYGLWEPSDENVRIETKYRINVVK